MLLEMVLRELPDLSGNYRPPALLRVRMRESLPLLPCRIPLPLPRPATMRLKPVRPLVPATLLAPFGLAGAGPLTSAVASTTTGFVDERLEWH